MRGVRDKRSSKHGLWKYLYAILAVTGTVIPLSWVFLAHWIILPTTTTNNNNNNNNNNNDATKSSKRWTKAAEAEAASLPKKPLNPTGQQCSYREYPAKRYYGLNLPRLQQPDFLRDAEYIYGQMPILLQADHDLGKICVNQSAWHNDTDGTHQQQLPFSDGTNPALLSARHIRNRVDKDSPWFRLLEEHNHNIAYVAMTVFKDQVACQWRDSEYDISKYKLSRRSKYELRGTLFVWLDHQLQTIRQTQVYLERDAPIGRSYPPVVVPATVFSNKNNNNNNNKTDQKDDQGRKIMVFAKELWHLDDPRLLVHKGQFWISFCLFVTGIRKRQLFAPLHLVGSFFELKSQKQETSSSNSHNPPLVWVRASEIVKVCCGRNMAVVDYPPPYHSSNEQNELHILQYIDPVSVISGSKIGYNNKESMKWMELDNTQLQRDPKKYRKKLSHFHGSNGFLPYVPQWDEFLSIGHFHRPRFFGPDNNNMSSTGKHQGSHNLNPSKENLYNEYAPFGHHYTHAFYTITAHPPHELSRLSREFVFPAKTLAEDGDVIQFITSLELAINNGGSDEEDDYALIGYGINDCESSIVKIRLNRIKRMLHKVAQGQQVVDLMKKLPNG